LEKYFTEGRDTEGPRRDIKQRTLEQIKKIDHFIGS